MAPPEGTKDRILAAAIEAFSEVGFAGARIDAIARKAGCNKQLLYHHFGNKEALYDAVLASVLARKVPPVLRTPTDAADHVVQIFREGADERDWFRLILWEALELGRDTGVGVEARRAKFAEAAALLRQAEAAGLLKLRHAPEVTVLAMLALTSFPWMCPQVTGMVLLEQGSPSDMGYEDLLRDVAALLLDTPWQPRRHEDATPAHG